MSNGLSDLDKDQCNYMGRSAMCYMCTCELGPRALTIPFRPTVQSHVTAPFAGVEFTSTSELAVWSNVTVTKIIFIGLPRHSGVKTGAALKFFVHYHTGL
ncbi:hypothetical protein AcV5_007659 [Taiwanofungus camphoratus]|nr:hypothetical protein AcW2_007313 [Antrodia cinnamomea]KAI0927014.1 hypothetical protein AcV5_007659 [Antrodia cinnamomea]